MQHFLNVLKKNKYHYIIAISIITTIILVNSILDFADKIKRNPLLLSFSLLIFYFFVTISIKEEIWKNGK